MNDKVDVRLQSKLKALEQAALRLGQGDDELLFEAVLAGVAQITGAERMRLLSVDPESGELHLLATLGDFADEAEALAPALVEQALADVRVHLSQPDPEAAQALVAPLRYGGRSLGLIHALGLATTTAAEDEPALLALANLAAAALDRAASEASLAAAEQARREYVSLTTHQLRVPLTSISGFTDLMLSGIAGSLTERQEQFMRTVQRNVGRMTVLIADLSDLNRIEDGRMPLDVAAFDLKAAIESVLQKQTQRIAERGHHLQRQLPEGLPAAFGDRAAVERIVEKILDNAIRYTPEGGSLTVGAVHHDRRLQVTVADDGIGIDPDDQARLFRPFFRSEVEAVREHTGWGLSLALVKALLEALGGALWYESQPGAGTVFHFALPAAGTTMAASSSGQ